MSIHYSGTLKRSLGVVSAIGKQLKKINLKGVKRVTVTFDPFAEQVKSTREFLYLLSTPKVVQTNPNCRLKTDVVCDRRKPEIKFSLIDSVQEQANVKEIRILSENLNTLELLQLFNKRITALAPVEEPTSKISTKSEKQKLAGGAGSVGKKAIRKK